MSSCSESFVVRYKKSQHPLHILFMAAVRRYQSCAVPRMMHVHGHADRDSSSPCSCATAYILLAEEEATTIMEAERLFKQALKAGEGCYRRSQQLQHHSTQYEAQHSEYSAASHLRKAERQCWTLAMCVSQEETPTCWCT